MTDARWHDVDEDVSTATRHFRLALRIRDGHASGEDPELAGYVTSMAFMHAVQSGYTSLEAALMRILDILGEERPTGDSWHRDLLRRAARSLEERPAILPADLLPALDELRGFRHRAMHAYNEFEDVRAEPAALAAERVANELPPALSAFRNRIDP